MSGANHMQSRCATEFLLRLITRFRGTCLRCSANVVMQIDTLYLWLVRIPKGVIHAYVYIYICIIPKYVRECMFRPNVHVRVFVHVHISHTHTRAHIFESMLAQAYRPGRTTLGYASLH